MKNQRSFSQKIWGISAPAPILSLSALQEHLLQQRGLSDHTEIASFLSPALTSLHDPYDFVQMRAAVDRIFTAIQTDERVVIFGDFDTDGITSTVILVRTLQQLGANVSYRIPDRNTDSHGLKTHQVDELALREVGLIVTCDCGINDHEQITHAQNLGIDVIVTDHHDPDPAQSPDAAVAVINPALPDSGYPEKSLSGSAVAFKLAMALLAEKFEKDELVARLLPLLEVTTLGVVADCVPLVGENRTIVKFGLEQIKKSAWSGLRMLLERAGTPLESISGETIGFVIGPRLNAASRIGDVMVAAQLFLGDDSGHAARIEQLENWNVERRSRTEHAVEKSREQIRDGAACQVLYAPEWTPGILGLVAARHVQQLGVPVIACSRRVDGSIGASCRAPEGYSMIDGLRSAAEHLKYFGGHSGAAGFLTKLDDLPQITAALDDFFAAQRPENVTLPIAAEIAPELVDGELLDFFKFLAPFGTSNAEPILLLKKVSVTDVRPMGKGQHFRIAAKCDGRELELVAFFAGHLEPHLKKGAQIDVAVTVGENFFRGERKLQLRIEDARATKN